MAQYEVVPFMARISNQEGVSAAAEQLKGLINKHAAQGWKYVRIESIVIDKEGTAGCFGLGSTPGSTTRFDMVVFER